MRLYRKLVGAAGRDRPSASSRSACSTGCTRSRGDTRACEARSGRRGTAHARVLVRAYAEGVLRADQSSAAPHAVSRTVRAARRASGSTSCSVRASVRFATCKPSTFIDSLLVGAAQCEAHRGRRRFSFRRRARRHARGPARGGRAPRLRRQRGPAGLLAGAAREQHGDPPGAEDRRPANGARHARPRLFDVGPRRARVGARTQARLPDGERELEAAAGAGRRNFRRTRERSRAPSRSTASRASARARRSAAATRCSRC